MEKQSVNVDFWCDEIIVIHRKDNKLSSTDYARMYLWSNKNIITVDISKEIIDVGSPDLKTINQKNNFYIEVKINHDGLHKNQVLWINKNPDKKVIILYLKINYIEENLIRDLDQKCTKIVDAECKMCGFKTQIRMINNKIIDNTDCDCGTKKSIKVVKNVN